MFMHEIFMPRSFRTWNPSYGIYRGWFSPYSEICGIREKKGHSHPLPDETEFKQAYSNHKGHE